MNMSEQNTLNIKKLERVDESFYFDKNARYDLIFKFNGNKFQALAFDSDRKKFVLQAEFHLFDGQKQYKDVLANTDFLQKDFARVIYVNTSTQHALVPEPFYDLNKEEELLNFQNSELDLYKLHRSNLPMLNAKMIFAMDIQELALVRSKFPDLEVLHSSACLFTYIQHVGMQGYTMYINMNEDQFELALMQNNNCILYNTFKFKTIEDFIYFPVYISEQFGIPAAQLQIVLMGDVEAEDERHAMLKNYFQQIFFASIDRKFEYASRIEKEKSIHRFAYLYNALICE